MKINVENFSKAELYDTIDKLLDIVLQWDNDNSERAIQRCYANGVDTKILAEFFGKSKVAEAIYKYINNEEEFTEDEDETPLFDGDEIDDIFDSADTLPENSELIDNITNSESDYRSTIKLLEKLDAVYDYEELASEKRITIFEGRKSDDTNEFLMELYFEPNGAFSSYSL